MASITLTVASTGINGSKAYTFTDAEIVRFVTMLKAQIGPAATNTDGLLSWANQVITKATTDTLQYEQRLLAASATSLNPV